MKLVYTLMYMYLLFRPYYLFKSGGIQISDVFLILAFCLLLLVQKNDNVNLKAALKEHGIFLLFTAFTCFINLIYYIMYSNFTFILSSLYFIFIFFAIILFTISFKCNDCFAENIAKIFKFNLIVQFLIYLLGIGRFYDSTRYMGTFNDPNQFGYYVLLSFCFIFVISRFSKRKKMVFDFFYWMLSLFLIILSASTGMMLGLFAFLVLFIIDFIKYINVNFKAKIKKIVFCTISLAYVCLLLFVVLNLSESLNDRFMGIVYNNNIINRIEGKINKSKNSGSNVYRSMNLWQERGYDKIFLYPQYIIYGAGEGEYTRFVKAAHNNEIHATFPSILFYYGIFPLILILSWVYKNIKHTNHYALVAFFALFVESFTLLNQRQVLFWTFIILCNHFRKGIEYHENKTD